LGGFEMGDEVAQMIAEEAGRSLAPEFVSTLLVAANALAYFAPAELRERYLPGAMDASLRVAVDASLMAPSTDSGRFALGPCDADLLITLVEMTDCKGTELAIIECTGTELRAADSWDLTRQISVICNLPTSMWRLGPAAMQSVVRLFAILIASDSLGAWDRICRRTIDYLGLREQFGRKLGSFQALKHRLADLHADYHVRGALVDAALLSGPSAGESRGDWALLAKAEATDAAARAAAACLQLHGGIGFTHEHECHLFLKRTRLNQSLIADNDILRSHFGREFVRNTGPHSSDQELPRALG
jgi:hypothetical protein